MPDISAYCQLSGVQIGVKAKIGDHIAGYSHQVALGLPLFPSCSLPHERQVPHAINIYSFNSPVSDIVALIDQSPCHPGLKEFVIPKGT